MENKMRPPVFSPRVSQSVDDDLEVEIIAEVAHSRPMSAYQKPITEFFDPDGGKSGNNVAERHDPVLADESGPGPSYTQTTVSTLASCEFDVHGPSGTNENCDTMNLDLESDGEDIVAENCDSETNVDIQVENHGSESDI